MTTAPFSVAAKARDLTFEFNDSCNCCCFGHSSPKKNQQVYVNSEGKVTEFDHKKADDDMKAMQRCISNLSEVIKKMAEERSKDKEEVMEEINRKVVSLSSSTPTPVTLGMIERIRNLMGL